MQYTRKNSRQQFRRRCCEQDINLNYCWTPCCKFPKEVILLGHFNFSRGCILILIYWSNFRGVEARTRRTPFLPLRSEYIISLSKPNVQSCTWLKSMFLIYESYKLISNLIQNFIRHLGCTDSINPVSVNCVLNIWTLSYNNVHRTGYI